MVLHLLRPAIVTVFLASCISVETRVQVSMFPGAGLPDSAYTRLLGSIEETLEFHSSPSQAEICIAHSTDGLETAIRSTLHDGMRCQGGLVALASAPLPEQIDKVTKKLLVVGGDMDGVVPFSHFAVSRHRSMGIQSRRFAALRGASHKSFTNGDRPLLSNGDLKPSLSVDHVHTAVAMLVRGFLDDGNRTANAIFTAAELAASELAKPIIDALLLEGSTQLGKPACNSDFPTNPKCQYPKWPDHSLPFGPAPAPNPPLPSDCVCGSPWVANTASPMLAGLPDETTLITKDAFHDVSDTHPFHLPHIFNTCKSPDASCALNTTTLTMPFNGTDDLWPSSASQPVSVLELRSKIKSREAFWTNANVPNPSSHLDDSMKMCADINQAALTWAMQHADSEVLKRYTATGEPFVIVDDKEATIGVTGPEWIKDKLVFSRVKDASTPTGTRVEVQSWKFVVANTNGGDVPWFFPVGMHYCKLLSPARVMEWIYTYSQPRSIDAVVV